MSMSVSDKVLEEELSSLRGRMDFTQRGIGSAGASPSQDAEFLGSRTTVGDSRYDVEGLSTGACWDGAVVNRQPGVAARVVRFKTAWGCAGHSGVACDLVGCLRL